MGLDAALLKKTKDGYEFIDIGTRYWEEQYQRGNFPKIIAAICEAWEEGTPFIYTHDCDCPSVAEFKIQKKTDKKEILALVESFLDVHDRGMK